MSTKKVTKKPVKKVTKKVAKKVAKKPVKKVTKKVAKKMVTPRRTESVLNQDPVYVSPSPEPYEVEVED